MQLSFVLLMLTLLFSSQKSSGGTVRCLQLHGCVRIAKWSSSHRGTTTVKETTLSSSIATQIPKTSCDAFKSSNIIYRICLKHKYRKW
ncbi:hypothetical protein AB6A40_001471 [Gnathostoma spinigerum]|uniref:Secreted protein n=1 Tax=Gnathostoma spinigerum TaxID=75299 RepID=A0ABD6EDI4_9BILA